MKMGRAACGLPELTCQSQRVSLPVPAVAGELWIVTHTELRDTARVRAFLEMVGIGLSSMRDLIEGRAPADTNPDRLCAEIS